MPIESRGGWKPDGDADQTNGPCRARGKQKCEYPRRRPALLGKRCCCILKRGCLNTNSGGTADDSSVLCVIIDRTDVFYKEVVAMSEIDWRRRKAIKEKKQNKYTERRGKENEKIK